MSNQTTLLLLGADGFVGGHVRSAAEAAGLRVVGATRGSCGDLRCDLGDPSSVNEAVRRASPSLVVNLAGLASVGESWRRPADAFTVNVTGVVNLLEAVAAHAPRAHVTCVSSGEVYGDGSEGKALSEDQPIVPLSPYGTSKAAMELVCGQYARSHRLSIAVIRAFYQLGPGQSPRFAASDFARQVASAELAGKQSVVLSVGNIAVVRDFTDVRDSCKAYVAVAQRRLSGTFNLCSGKGMELKTLIDQIASAGRLTVTIDPDPGRRRATDIPHLVGSPERLQEATGWAPSTPLPETVSDLVDWWRTELRGEKSAETAQESAVRL